MRAALRALSGTGARVGATRGRDRRGRRASCAGPTGPRFRCRARPGPRFLDARATGEVREALREQSRFDWEAFLTHRARELRLGGQLTVLGGGGRRDERACDVAVDRRV
ncbi:hypothetical protein GCM10019016_066000 [Streptomyces prasinosporus]|uniref:Uncharacterized protein n=1 Tax=Streptomyces prasinosporus TaxID=68256 RepID=A0ABP6TZJ2_9ACTN|nr:hypothetical protein GCM10010332_40430 [Streptomyces albogriseolus]